MARQALVGPLREVGRSRRIGGWGPARLSETLSQPKKKLTNFILNLAVQSTSLGGGEAFYIHTYCVNDFLCTVITIQFAFIVSYFDMLQICFSTPVSFLKLPTIHFLFFFSSRKIQTIGKIEIGEFSIDKLSFNI